MYDGGTQKITVHPLTIDRWADLEALFGPRGACGGCWCMSWRLPRSQFDKQKGSGNKRAFKAIVKSGTPPGLLAYVGGEPVGWCALAPRECYPALGRSRILAPIDDQPVWSITCFFVARPYRRQGISVHLLEAAVKFAKRRGARIVEGYPQEPASGPWPDAFVWTGTAAAFRRAGFVEVARRSAARPIMRYRLK
ncbi:MAG: GNAT family N-acetyltransferase [Candidatus Zixiibacteriota bacterium]